MTIHRSKGLEFNAVILPCINKSVLSRTASSDSIVCGDNSIGIRLYNDGVRLQNAYHIANSREQDLACRAEEMRILYVALTRARDTLVLIGSMNDVRKNVHSFECSGKDAEDYILSCKSTAGCLFCALGAEGMLPVLDEAVSLRHSDFGNLTVTYTPIYELALPEQVTDTAYFEKALNDIMSEDTTEVAAEMESVYPYEECIGLVSKGSVTGFAHTQTEVVYGNYSIPNESGVSAAQRGTATHLVFELIPLECHSKKSVVDFVDTLVDRGLLSRQEADSVNTDGIAAFFSRPLFKRMQASENVWREKEFTCFVEACMVTDTELKEPVLLQGVIDCCFTENGRWILLDYKTDAVNPNDSDAVTAKAQSHRKQLELYSYVLKKLTGIPVAECYICFVNAYDVKVEM